MPLHVLDDHDGVINYQAVASVMPHMVNE